MLIVDDQRVIKKGHEKNMSFGWIPKIFEAMYKHYQKTLLDMKDIEIFVK